VIMKDLPQIQGNRRFSFEMNSDPKPNLWLS
jgi:hypothetical protein